MDFGHWNGRIPGICSSPDPKKHWLCLLWLSKLAESPILSLSPDFQGIQPCLSLRMYSEPNYNLVRAILSPVFIGMAAAVRAAMIWGFTRFAYK